MTVNGVEPVTTPLCPARAPTRSTARKAGGTGWDFGAFTAPVNVTLYGERNDGEAGQDLLLGVENVLGGSGDDTLTGDGAANVLGGAAGADLITGGRGRDLLRGDAGGDLLRARDGERDTADCGAARDLVFVDEEDEVVRSPGNRCEHTERGAWRAPRAGETLLSPGAVPRSCACRAGAAHSRSARGSVCLRAPGSTREAAVSRFQPGRRLASRHEAPHAGLSGRRSAAASCSCAAKGRVSCSSWRVDPSVHAPEAGLACAGLPCAPAASFTQSRGRTPPPRLSELADDRPL